MDKAEHGRLLSQAMGERNLMRQDIVTVTGVSLRTVTNWSTGATMPSEQERAQLRKLLPGYDRPGDAVERAVRGSELQEWRQDAVLSVYKRNLYEQRADLAQEA